MFGNQPTLKDCYDILKGRCDKYEGNYQSAMLGLMGMFNTALFMAIFLFIIERKSVTALIFAGCAVMIVLSGMVTGVIFKDKSLWMPIYISKSVILTISPIVWFYSGGYAGWGGLWFIIVGTYLLMDAKSGYGNVWEWIMRLELPIVFILTYLYPQLVMPITIKVRNWTSILVIFVGIGYVFEEILAKQRVLDYLQKRNNEMSETMNAQNQELLAVNQELTAVNQELTAVNEELNEMTDKLKEANEVEESARLEADSANQAKGRFLANMSHEIRTPINVVLGMNTMIRRKSQNKEIVKYADDIQRAGKSLLALVNDILDFSKIEAGKMEIVPVDYDLSDLIYDVHNMISTRARDKELEFVMNIDEELPERCFGDDVRIKQVLTNLLTNAVKYTPQGVIEFNVSKNRSENLSEDEVSIHFSVKDTGIGIKPEDIEKLTEGFVRIEESRNRNIEGTGLGINIVVSLLDLMGSRLEIDSVYGEGSHFYFDLVQKVTQSNPIGNINERINQEADESIKYVAQLCIPDSRLLVVDDNALNRAVFVNLLSDMECQIDEAESGKQCLELVTENKYDIVFMDHMMPEMDGVETFRHMQEMGDYINADTPVVILTANAISGAREEYLAEGFMEYLSKPVDVDKLEQVVETLIPEEKKHPACKIIGRETGAKQAESVNDDSAEEKSKELPYIDGVNWYLALQNLKDTELLMEIIDSVVETSADDMAKLKSYHEIINASGEGFSDFRVKVHSMKSNAATIGAVHVAGLAKYLEYAARDNDADTINSLMPIFVKQWNALMADLITTFNLKAESDKELKPIDSAELKYLLNILQEAMNGSDIDRADAVVEELGEHLYPKEQTVLFEKIRTCVLNINVDECNSTAQEWIGVL